MTREQEAIERMANAAWRDPNELKLTYNQCDAIAKKMLDALLSPSPCPTCGGTGKTNKVPTVALHVEIKGWSGICTHCNGIGTVPPLLRWNDEP